MKKKEQIQNVIAYLFANNNNIQCELAIALISKHKDVLEITTMFCMLLWVALKCSLLVAIK